MQASNRNFQAFLIGRVIAAAGATIAPLLITFSSLRYQADGSLLAGVLSTQIIIQLAAIIVGGLLIDRWNRKLYITSCYTFSALVFGALAVFLLADLLSAGTLLIFGALTGLMSGLTGPSIQSVMPQLVPKEDLQEKNANLRIALNTVVVIVPALGGWAMSLIELGWIAAYVAGMYCLAAIAMTRLPHLKRGKPSNMIFDLKEGWKTFIRTRWFIITVAACGVMNMLWAGFFQVIGPITVNDTSSGPQAWGIITASLSAGLIIGGFVFKRIHLRQPIATGVLALASKALPLIALASGSPIWVIAGAAFMSGLLLECFVINFYTTTQKLIPENHLGKLLSIDAFIGLALMPAGYALAAAATASSSVSVWTMSAAAVTIVVALVAAKFCKLPKSSLEEPIKIESRAK